MPPEICARPTSIVRAQLSQSVPSPDFAHHAGAVIELRAFGAHIADGHQLRQVLARLPPVRLSGFGSVDTGQAHALPQVVGALHEDGVPVDDPDHSSHEHVRLRQRRLDERQAGQQQQREQVPRTADRQTLTHAGIVRQCRRFGQPPGSGIRLTIDVRNAPLYG